MGLTNFPVQLTSFIGREREIAAVKSLLANAHLITLTGAGGCGKTRLAIQIANEVTEAFEDGVWFVDLAPLNEPGLVPQLVVEALSLRFASTQPVLESLLSFLRAKRMLLILDNCEHLINASAQLAQQVLSHAPDLRILATSRGPLAIAGERIFPLSGLAWPAFDSETVRNLDLQDLFAYDAVRMFIERACAFLPDFTTTSENALAIAEICQRLDGLPLAIELASARVNVLTVQEIAERLKDRFTLLISGQRTDRIPRHQTLRAAIDWSYALLTTEEQIFLGHLAVFAAGCTLDTAEVICSGAGIGEGRTLDLLSSLVDKSFVITETSGRTQARYRLLETIREYTLEKLEGVGKTARLRDNHLDLFLARAEEAAPNLHTAYQKLWLNWLEGEHDNLRGALAWALESSRIEAGLRIAIALTRFWEIRGYVQEGLTWFERLLALADERISPVVHANALTYASFMAMFLGKASIATAYGHEAIALAEASGDEGNPILILALGSLATGARTAGDYQTAFSIGERVIQLLRESSGPPFYLGMALLAQGGGAIELGDYDTAHAALDESLAIAQADGDAFRIAHALNSIGDLARCEKKYEDAQTAYENSVAHLREVGAQHDLASVLHNLGHTCLHLGDVERAYSLFRESMAAHQAAQNVPGMSECLIGFAAVALLRGLPAVGARLLSASETIGGQRVATASVWHATRMEYEQYLDLARATLTETEFQTEQVAGRAITLEQAIDYAQNFLLKPGVSLSTEDKLHELSDREREVATLIVGGKSNREIATELFISTRTVEKHVANILSKLELTSRTQIVHWMMAHSL